MLQFIDDCPCQPDVAVEHRLARDPKEVAHDALLDRWIPAAGYGTNIESGLTNGVRSVELDDEAGDASLYARPGDERHLAQLIVELIDDEARRKFMGDEGYRRMTEELEWRHQAPKLLEAYTAVLRKKSEVTVSAR